MKWQLLFSFFIIETGMCYIAHQLCSLQMSYKRIGLYDACMILYQRKWYALYSASAFRPFPLFRNLFEFYLHIYQMYLFRRCHCIHIIASILQSWPIPSLIIRYIAHGFFIIHSSLRPLLLLSLRKVSLSEKIDAWLLDLQGPNKEWIGRYIIIYHEIMLYLIWI